MLVLSGFVAGFACGVLGSCEVGLLWVLVFRVFADIWLGCLVVCCLIA